MRFIRFAFPLALALTLASSALARTAAIETTAPLADHSDASIEAAVKEAVAIAIRGALAMGFQWVQLHEAAVLDDAVSIRILAGDAEESEPDADAPDATRPEV